MKRLFKVLLIVLLFIFSLNVNASEYNDGSARSSMPDLGVHKHWTITDKNKPNVITDIK